MFKHSVFQNYTLTDATGEVLLMWLISFLLGLLLGYLIWGSLKRRISLLEQDLETWKDKYKKSEARNKQLKADLEDCRSKKRATKTVVTKAKVAKAPAAKAKAVAVAAVPKAKAKKPVSKKDNLKVVEGIGPKIEGLLNADGIKTWIQLSQADLDRLRKILDDAGPRYRIHDPSTWPKQAELASDDKWDALKKLQDKLKGGRKV